MRGIILGFLILFVAYGFSFQLAKWGEPRSEWFWCRVLSMCESQ